MEQILTDLAHFDPHRLASMLINYASPPPASTSVPNKQQLQMQHGQVMSPILAPASSTSTPPTSSSPSSPLTQLLALHVLAPTIKQLTSTQLLLLLPALSSVAIPSLTSQLVDVRKAVVFVLVEAYLVVGPALYPFVKDLAPAQKKLLTIYIERQNGGRAAV